MKSLAALILMLFMATSAWSTEESLVAKKDCYEQTTSVTGRDMAAFLCNQIRSSAETAFMQHCHQSMKTHGVSTARSAILCYGLEREDQISLVQSCYDQLQPLAGRNPAAILCHQTNSESEIAEIKGCYQNVRSDVSKYRSAILCKSSPIGLALTYYLKN